MKVKSRQSGLTLMEQTVVIVSVAMLVYFGLPAVRTFLDSFETQSGAKTMISAALASARAIAAKEQRYAGVRFQKAYNRDATDPLNPLNTRQYMIFIVQDPEILAWGFRAVEGIEPIKLPDSVGVMDLSCRTNYSDPEKPADDPIDNNGEIDEPRELRDTTAFSIIFSPSGKLVIHEVRVRNRDGIRKPETPDDSQDDIFNSFENIENYNIGMFIQDDYADWGLGQEVSRSKFIIYDRTVFEKVDKNRRYSDYLRDLDVIYINPYTGTMIKR